MKEREGGKEGGGGERETERNTYLAFKIAIKYKISVRIIE